ncbi:hypothetical protein SPF06_21590 [Sinomonas sp. JGH33]|uniref:Uncharacterized protein n=1 Tax=Sinomonas terricola TaxID=3110330 RepID=A0ABU5TCV3_9MICC|nr:hypothetical protein [Sinomonas sp. JGH33]MEA5457319.1 hypothetical protein [Sinomonas sp. JGH33]
MGIPELLGEAPERGDEPFREIGDATSWVQGGRALETALAMGADAYSTDSPGRLVFSAAAGSLKVQEATVARWIRDGLPHKRAVWLSSVVGVGAGQLEQERVQLGIAQEAARTLGLKGVKATDWRARGLDEPHVLYLVWLPALGVWIPRVGRLSETTHQRSTGGAGGGRIVRRRIFDNYFLAAVEKFEVLEAYEGWRVSVPRDLKSVTGVKKLQGRSSAVLACAGTPLLGDPVFLDL